jgi:hypothetical protein
MTRIKHSAATPGQPISKLVLYRAHGSTFHHSKAFMDFETGQFLQVEPIFLDQFVANLEIGIHCSEHFDCNTEVGFRENLRFEFGTVLFVRGPRKYSQAGQARKNYSSYPAPESEMLVVPVYWPAVLKYLDNGIAAVGRFLNRKVGILSGPPRRALAVRALPPVHAGVERATFFRHDKGLKRGPACCRFRRQCPRRVWAARSTSQRFPAALGAVRASHEEHCNG